MNKTIDESDKRILNAIQLNSRINGADLAEQVHLSKSAALQRLRALERKGYIDSYQTRLNPKKVSYGYLVYVQVKLSDTTKEALTKFNAVVNHTPQILACDMLTAGFDYLLKVRCADMQQFALLHSDVISTLPYLQHTASFPVMQEVKDTSYLQVEVRD